MDSVESTISLTSFLSCWQGTYLCCLLDIEDAWKSFVVYTNVPIEEISKIADNRLFDWKSPTRELLKWWKNDATATIERFLEILSIIKQYNAVSWTKRWIKEQQGEYDSNLESLTKKQKLNTDSVKETITEQIPGEEDYRIGMIWYRGDRYEEAKPYFEKSSQFHNPLALLHLCSLLQHLRKSAPRCVYTEQCKEHRDWFLQRARTGDPIAQYFMGMYCELIPDTDEKQEYWYEPSAKQGYAPAQHNLACFYAEKDNEKALYWFQKASDQGYHIASRNLGWMFEHGVGVAKDKKIAMSLYQTGAEDANAECQCSLGVSYYLGKDFQNGSVKALALYKKAADSGLPRGCYYLAIYYESGLVGNGEQQAIEWYEKAAKYDYLDAQYSLGLLYYRKRDHAKAIVWLQKATDLGHIAAPRILGKCHESGKAVPRNLKTAASLYKLSATWGDRLGQLELANCYRYGRGVPQSYEQAVYWYHKAADQSDDDARVALGWCYELGNGVEQDHSTALYWMEQSKRRNALQNLIEVHKKDTCRKEEDVCIED